MADVGSPKANKSKSSCCVPHCDKTGYMVVDGKKVTFHSFPKEEERVTKWVVKIKRDIGPNFMVTSYTKICSMHFEDSDFRVTLLGRKFLKEGVVPSVFPWSKVSQLRILDRDQATVSMDIDASQVEECLDTASNPTTIATSESHELDARIAELEQLLQAERVKITKI